MIGIGVIGIGVIGIGVIGIIGIGVIGIIRFIGIIGAEDWQAGGRLGVGGCSPGRALAAGSRLLF